MKIIKLINIIGFISMILLISCEDQNILENLLRNSDERINRIMKDPNKYELQILYTKVDRENGNISLNTYSFNEKTKKYFYPASTVKFPAAVLALEKLNEINMDGVDKKTHLVIDKFFEDHVSFDEEYMTECGYPNIADYIKQIFIVSDNESFNRLYDFLGPKDLNEGLRKRDFNNTKIIHRLSVARTQKQNMETNPVKFFDHNSKLLFTKEARTDSVNFDMKLEETNKGIGYYSNGKLINNPKDFSMNNFFSLRDQHNLLIRIMLPELFNKNERFNLTDEDYNFLRKYMSMLPKESDCPKYPKDKYYDGYVKFLMFGDTKANIPRNLKIYSKSGLAYGYLTDNAYIVDEDRNIEFFLSATIHVNENKIYNDDKYEYDEIGLPFLAKLGHIIYSYEKERPR